MTKTCNVLSIPLNEERLKKLTENYLAFKKNKEGTRIKKMPVSARKWIEKSLNDFELT